MSNNDFSKILNDTLTRIMGQREEILTAFVAKYGCQPERVVQIEQTDEVGNTYWYVREMTEGEYNRTKGVKLEEADVK